jgi:hypothetical protein
MINGPLCQLSSLDPQDISAGICEVRDSHSYRAESSSSLDYDAVSLCCRAVTMKTLQTFETSVITRPTTRRHIPEN